MILQKARAYLPVNTAQRPKRQTFIHYTVFIYRVNERYFPAVNRHE